MKAVRLTDSPSGPVLCPTTTDRPKPGSGEVLIRVGAAGVTTTELGWYPTTHTKSGELRVGAIPGHEFAGVIEELGADAGDFKAGDQVFGMNDWYADGATAEYCVAPQSALALKPSGLSDTEAASVPIGALTAWQGLFDRANLQPGEHVLVHGGAGAVGLFAVQLAKVRGARVTATASARDLEMLSELGVDQVIDYQAARFEDAAGQVDVVFDTVGGETLDRSWKVLKPAGRMVTIASSAADSADERVKKAFFIVEPKGTQLREIAGLIGTAKLQFFVAATVPLARAAEAYSGKLPRMFAGKIVVTVP